jgi:hypothetical protein
MTQQERSMRRMLLLFLLLAIAAAFIPASVAARPSAGPARQGL